jgi:hypothetical protein
MKMVNFVLFLLVASFAGAEDEFVPLFNGRDLSGWSNVACAPDTWTVTEDGMIHCSGVPTGTMITDRQYENFVLELEWRHLKPGGNAGVFVWAESLSAKGTPFLRGIEVQVLDHAYGKSDWFTTHGDVFPIHGSTMEPFPPSKGQRSFPSEERGKGSPEWNHYRITCKDGVLWLAVNGKDVSGGKNCNYRKGYIALESEGGIVDYRNIRIKELPSSDAKPEETAPLNEGFTAIYTGTNLDGWNAKGEWKASDWILKCGGGELTTVKELGDCEVVFDFKLPKEGEVEGGILFGGLAKDAVKLSDQPRGKWGRVRMKLEGKSTFGLWVEGGAAEFANVFVREL